MKQLQFLNNLKTYQKDLLFVLVFVLMTAYSMLKPVRDAVGGDWDNVGLAWSWTVNFVLRDGLVWSDGEPLVITCRCAGSIAHKPGDTGGFGYEPLFIVDEFGKTMAKLNEEERQRVSALSQAIRQLVPALEKLLNERLRGAYI